MKIKRVDDDNGRFEEAGGGRFEIWVGPKEFQQFEDALLPIERWTHEKVHPDHLTLWWKYWNTHIILDPEQCEKS